MKERKSENKRYNRLRVRVYDGDPVKMRQNERTRGRVLGAEWNGRYLKQCVQTFDLPQDVCISIPQEKGREKNEFRATTPFLPLRPLPQPPAAPSHSSYEPRAGRSEYNFLYCVNVRIIRLNKKKNVYITKRRHLDHCVPSSLHVVSKPRDERGSRFTSVFSMEMFRIFKKLNDERARKLKLQDLESKSRSPLGVESRNIDLFSKLRFAYISKPFDHDICGTWNSLDFFI